jgi:hypothetical protein
VSAARERWVSLLLDGLAVPNFPIDLEFDEKLAAAAAWCRRAHRGVSVTFRPEDLPTTCLPGDVLLFLRARIPGRADDYGVWRIVRAEEIYLARFPRMLLARHLRMLRREVRSVRRMLA